MSALAAAEAAAYNWADQTRMREARNYFAWQYRLAAPYLGPCVIEIGCGIGNFTWWLRDRQVTAVDPDPACLRELQRRLPAMSGLRTVRAAAGQGQLPVLAAADSCIALNVLEHIGDDHRALAEMGALVRPGGHVILLVPAFAALYGRVDRQLGHCRRYRRRGFAALATAAGLCVERLHYVNRLGFFAWWLNARAGRAAQSPRQIARFDSLVPALERLESRLGWALPWGQSLFAVLCRGER